jgi:excisionase family DNA binding protein
MTARLGRRGLQRETYAMPALETKTKPLCTSIAGAADLIGVVPLTISRLIKAKKLRASRVGRRVVVRVADIEKYLDANPAVH